MTVTDDMMMAAASATGHTIHPEDLRKALEAALSASPAGVGGETKTGTHVTGTLRVLREGIKEAEADIAFDADAGNQSDASEYGVSLPYQTSREIASLLQSQVTCAHAPVEDEIARVVQSVNEWDDRTSPDDYPEHLLITSEELADILRNFAAALKGDEQ